jgi:uncharacterized protein (TIGR04255 family)
VRRVESAYIVGVGVASYARLQISSRSEWLMPFPEFEKVVYEQNPLDVVICQVRFPAILRIDSEVPAAFQERIRQYFPIYTEKSEATFDITPEMQAPIPLELARQFLNTAGLRKNHEFASEEGNWTVNVTRTFLALSTRDYREWEDFKRKFEIPFKALIAEYSPPFFSRIGLRYLDQIKRSSYGLADVSWDQLLQPYVAGFLGSPDISDAIASFENRAEIRLSDESSLVRVITKFVEAEDSGGQREMSFIIDSDFFNASRTPTSEVITKLDFFNIQASRLFRWSITDRLHKAIEATHP